MSVGALSHVEAHLITYQINVNHLFPRMFIKDSSIVYYDVDFVEHCFCCPEKL